MKKHVSVIHCDRPDKRNLRNNATVSELIVKKIKEFNPKIETKISCVMIGEKPDLDSTAAVIISGSGYNVDRNSLAKYEWMQNAINIIRKAHEMKIPVLGTCFGHQILAVAFGAKVYKMKRMNFGFEDVKIIGDFPFLDKNVKSFKGLFCHGFAVRKESLNDSIELLATTMNGDEKVVAAIRIGKRSMTSGVQFHPEMDNSDLRHYLEIEGDDIKKGRGGTFEGMDVNSDSSMNNAVLANFLKMALKK